ncbi:hypothetical protein RchiOBHm_Chr2g0091881 [Rosa chinensis]|uniref:Uncharacterized protein n=1 Tax=Rosa chinensis TaxID=74649 RepID=A0A2P6RJV8_ROSCH|nr:hypothetical protein RchiOBHm_Chr2g0091881 [Rosa chinensis]
MNTVRDYRDLPAESMFLYALNQRFFKIARRKDPPFVSCSTSADVLFNPLKAYMMTSSCKEKGTIQAQESILIEVARVRLHGFSEREVSIVRALLMSEIESAYLERDQMQSTSFIFSVMNLLLGLSMRLNSRRLFYLVNITAAEISKYAEKLQTSCSCVIKTIEPRASAIVEDLKNVVSKISALEEERIISPWDEEHIPEEIVSTKPNPGNIVQQCEYSNIGATELILSNGMRVCCKSTDFLDDQVQLFDSNAISVSSELIQGNTVYLSLSSLYLKL